MKSIELDSVKQLPGKKLNNDDRFAFRCHSALACFNQCCRNLNLFLYPYDVVRLRKQLSISSDEFIDTYVDVVLRESSFFPDVLLKMADNTEKTCPFLSDEGCSVYPDRPDTCRTFPVEQGAIFNDADGQHQTIHFFKPPEFCLGQHESKIWTSKSWAEDQQAQEYNRMTLRWAEIKRLFDTNPWGAQGPEGNKAKMAFMAAYNIDRFRDFVFGSSFFKRYKVKTNLRKKIRTDDKALLLFGFDWIKMFVWGKDSKKIRLKK